MKSLTNLLQIGFVWSVIYFGHILSTIVSEDEPAEDKLPSGIPIIRQINKVNHDGTYTYGYEAADGTFKIETRDVLGNVKGMFGFIDESGELKRVSYTANNSTGMRSRESISAIPSRSPVVSSSYTTVRPTPRDDAPTRKPVLLLKNTPTTRTSSKPPVIQHIPKKVLQEIDDLTTTSTTVGFEEYENGKQNYNTYQPSQENSTSDNSAEDTPQRMTTTTNNPLRKILVSKRPVEEKDTSKGKGGNALRRQLHRGFEIRAGDMSHVYSGDGYGKYSSTNVPSHLSALMSEFRPIQAPRPAYIAPPPTYDGPESEIPFSPQHVNDYPSATTEIPHDAGHKYSARLRSLRPTAAAIIDEPQYIIGEESAYRSDPIQQPSPIPIHINPNYQQSYEPYPSAQIPNIIREELITIIYNYLQTRLNNIQNQYYNLPAPLPPPPHHPRLPYYPPPNNLFLPNPNYPPYINQNLLPYSPQPYLPFVNQPQPLIYPLVPPNPIPYVNPNIQASSRHPNPIRSTTQSKGQTTRSPSTGAAADDADLLQMLLTSPTKIPIHQLKYAGNAERGYPSYRTTQQPVRNVQIISDSSNLRSTTTESSD